MRPLGHKPEQNQTAPAMVIGLDARKLKALLEQFIALCDAGNKKAPASVKFSLYGPERVIRMDCSRNAQDMMALLMPLRT